MICGNEFELKHPNQRYCSPKCKILAGKRNNKLRAKKYRENHQYDYRDYMMSYMWNWRRKYPERKKNSKKGKLGTQDAGTTPKITYENGEPNFNQEMEIVRKMNLHARGETRIPKSVINSI